MKGIHICSDVNKIDCKNGGSCVTKNGQSYCACPHGYEGRKCQFSTFTLDSQNTTGN